MICWYFSPNHAPKNEIKNPIINPKIIYFPGTRSKITSLKKTQSRMTANNPATAGSLNVTPGDLTPTINPVTAKLKMKPADAILKI